MGEVIVTSKRVIAPPDRFISVPDSQLIRFFQGKLAPGSACRARPSSQVPGWAGARQGAPGTPQRPAPGIARTTWLPLSATTNPAAWLPLLGAPPRRPALPSAGFSDAPPAALPCPAGVFRPSHRPACPALPSTLPALPFSLTMNPK